MGPLVLRRELFLNVPRERLWPVLGDTDRMNRAQGLPPVTYHVLPRGNGVAEIEGEARIAGLRIRWVEHPFEWVEGRRTWVVRTYRNGPLREMRGGISLADADGGTRVAIAAELQPRGLLGWLIARTAGPRLMRDFERVCRTAERQLMAEQPVALPGEAPADPAEIRRRAARILARQSLVSTNEPLLQRLVDFLATAPDRDASRIRPLTLARQWNGPGMEVLRTCLRATRAGLLELTWDVICPGCRGAKERATTLAELKSEGHCDTCQIRFDVNFDRSVEVSFRPHSQVRKVEDVRFCAFGPSNTPHVLAQVVLEPGQRSSETLSLPEGRFRLRSPDVSGATWIDALQQGGVAEAVFRLTPDGAETTTPVLAAGAVSVTAENGLQTRARLLIERAEWAQDVATAAMVSTVQEFRDLFSTEALAPDTQLTIGSLTFLFTDLKGSTALYTDLGDARAYALVRDHFAFLGATVRKQEGAIVKTIGDAIMAVFQDPLHGVECALELQKTVGEFNRARCPTEVRGGIIVKMGIHTGPCLAARLNDMLDYFGSTVNLASRVQHLSEGGDILITEAVASDIAVTALLQAEGLVPEQMNAELRGLPGSFLIRRLCIANALNTASGR